MTTYDQEWQSAPWQRAWADSKKVLQMGGNAAPKTLVLIASIASALNGALFVLDYH